MTLHLDGELAEGGRVLLIIATVVAAWTAVSLLVIGCCLSAAQGEQHGWHGNTAGKPRVKVLRGRSSSAKIRDRAHRAA
jgi:hypothetical protein